MKLFFSVGEPSGDLHGANLIRAIRARTPGVECVGYGGPRMAGAGCDLHADLTKLAVMWLLRALLNLHQFWKLVVQADHYFRHQKPNAVILIDYPGFNWWIARRAKIHGIPVFYYGAPQMWAWAAWRVHKMRRLVDHVLCKLPFEADWYRARQCRATYVGHPYFDEMQQQQLDRAFIAAQQLDPRPLVTILPGSRTQEVTANLAAFLKTAERTAQLGRPVRFAVASFNARQAELARQIVGPTALPLEIHVGRTPELIHCARVCLACSGSVSLELLFHAKPSVVHYQVGRIPFFIQRFFRKVRFITLVNLLASDDRYCTAGELYDAKRDDVPFPEFLTCGDESETMAEHLGRWLTDDVELARSERQLRELRHRFAVPGATAQAADYILRNLPAAQRAVRPHYLDPSRAA